MIRFGFLWGFALLYHQLGYGVALASPLDAALTATAVAAMLRPGSVPVLGALAAFHVGAVFQHLPAVYNHWYFASLVSLALLVAAGSVAWQALRSPAPRTPLAQHFPGAFFPAARVALLLVYLLSGFHKLNRDFFSPEVSCATTLYGRLSERLGGLPAGPALLALIIVLTLAIELGVPVLLMLPRLRGAGVVIALLFHVVLALAGYPRFSATGVALLTLFLPEHPEFGQSELGRVGAKAWAALAAPVTRALLVAGLAVGVAVGPVASEVLLLAAQLFLAAAVVAAALALLPVPAMSKPLAGAAAPRHWQAAMLAPVLVLASGLTPYLGLGTDRAFSMYSNLRTEDGRPNHFLIPSSIQVFGYQRDLVQVIESNTPRLNYLARRRLLVPYAEFRAIISEAPSAERDVAVTFVRRGERHVIPAARRDSSLAVPVPLPALKWLRFRPIEPTGKRQCTV